MSKKGKLIVIDGTDGSGKATQVKLLRARLVKEGYTVKLLDFPEYYKNFFGINVEKRVLSSSFLEKHGLVFWDLYGADKYVKR